MISVNNLKTDSENNNEKVTPSVPSPEPAINYLTEPVLSHQHINAFNLNDETSVSEYDKDEQNILYFNDIFPFNVTRPDDLNSKKDNNDSDIDIIQSSEGNEITHRSNEIMDTSSNKIDKIFDEESFVLKLNVNIVTWIYLFNGMLLCFILNLYVPFGVPFNPKRYYKDGDCAIMSRRPRYGTLTTTLERIYDREINRVQFVDFQGMPKLMRDGLFTRMRMEHRDDAGVVVFTSRAWGRLFDTRGPLFQLGGARRRLSWRQFILALGLHIEEEMESHGFARDPVLRLYHRIMAHSIAGRSQAHEKVIVTDLFYVKGLDVGSVNILYLLARYLRRFAAGRKKILSGLTVIALKLPTIDMVELAVPAPMQAPQQPPPQPKAPARTMPQRMARLEEDVHEIRRALTKQREVVDEMARDLSRFCTWTTTSLARMIDRAGVSYTSYTQIPIEYQRRVRRRTDDVGTSAVQQDQQQPDSCSLLIKPGSKFSTIVHDTEPCKIFTLNVRIRKKDDFK
ncbi:hypothetical protein Tco_0929944 [Tanacetum coccineum]